MIIYPDYPRVLCWDHAMPFFSSTSKNRMQTTYNVIFETSKHEEQVFNLKSAKPD